MEEKYVMNMSYLNRHVLKFLQKSVDNGQLEKIEGKVPKYKINKDKKKLSAELKSGKKVVSKKKNNQMLLLLQLVIVVYICYSTVLSY